MYLRMSYYDIIRYCLFYSECWFSVHFLCVTPCQYENELGVEQYRVSKYLHRHDETDSHVTPVLSGLLRSFQGMLIM